MNIGYQVEKIGIELANVGFPPIVCRVLGFLMVSEPEYQSFYQIQEFLKASKSAISYALNFLLNDGTIETVTFPGDRKRYFKMKIDSWIDIIRKRTLQITKAKTIFYEIAEERKVSNPFLSKSLQDISELYDQLEEKINTSIDEWASERKKASFPLEFNRLINKTK